MALIRPGPARTPSADDQATPAGHLPDAVRPVALLSGRADRAAVREWRAVLEDPAARTGFWLAIDLPAADDGHDLTLYGLLARAARTIDTAGSSLTVVNPPARLAAIPAASLIPAGHGQPGAPAPGGIQAIRTGPAPGPPRADSPGRPLRAGGSRA